jgi:hypothetical protein
MRASAVHSTTRASPTRAAVHVNLKRSCDVTYPPGLVTVADAAAAFQLVPVFATPVTVNVTDGCDDLTETTTAQTPEELVVHVFVPDAPPDNCTVTVAPETAPAPGTVDTVVVPVADHERRDNVAEPVITAVVVVVGGGGGAGTA